MPVSGTVCDTGNEDPKLVFTSETMKIYDLNAATPFAAKTSRDFMQKLAGGGRVLMMAESITGKDMVQARLMPSPSLPQSLFQIRCWVGGSSCITSFCGAPQMQACDQVQVVKTMLAMVNGIVSCFLLAQ